MQDFQVWNEGYAATGESGKAQYLGTYPAETFKEAVAKAIVAKNWDKSYFNEDRLTYWGCRFFDNEASARASFG